MESLAALVMVGLPMVAIFTSRMESATIPESAGRASRFPRGLLLLCFLSSIFGLCAWFARAGRTF
jgi:hypothetical protein